MKIRGVLTIAEGRRIIRKREEGKVAKVRKVVKVAELRARNAYKRYFKDIVKEARK